MKPPFHHSRFTKGSSLSHSPSAPLQIRARFTFTVSFVRAGYCQKTGRQADHELAILLSLLIVPFKLN